MHLIFILPIVTIGLINGAKGDFDPVFALFPDGSTIKAKGLWYAHGIQGDHNLHKHIKCYHGDVKVEGHDIFMDQFYEFSNGLPFQSKYTMGINTAPSIVLSFFERNEDNSRGRKVCDTVFQEFASHQRVVKYSANPPCKFGPGVVMAAVCASKNEELNHEDVEDLKKLCPPENSILLNHSDCKLD